MNGGEKGVRGFEHEPIAANGRGDNKTKLRHQRCGDRRLLLLRRDHDVQNQVRGSVIDGLAQALAGQEIEFIDGVVQQSNLHNFPLARITTTPQIEIAWVRSDKSPTGLGEPALPPVIPALTNAIWAASGTRIRSLPVRLTTT